MTGCEQQSGVNQELLGEIHQASAAMAVGSPVKPTHLFQDEALSKRHKADIWIASELHQVIGAYKIRGSYNFFRQMTPQEKLGGVVTLSAGNHAQAVAFCCRLFGTHGDVFMPEDAPEYKVQRTEQLGGDAVTVHLVGKTLTECCLAAQLHCKSQDATFVHPFDEPSVVAGQGTLGLEIADRLPDLDAVFCPVGGMGLLAGISTAIKARNPKTDIIGAEPEGAASLSAALEHGKPVNLGSNIDTLADGASVPQVGAYPFAVASHLVKQVVRVSNARLRATTTEFWERPVQQLRGELAGLLTPAAVEQSGYPLLGKRVLCIVSGGNLSQERYDREVRCR